MKLTLSTPLGQAFSALRGDLLHGDGPRISTMRNYRFAIVQYRPEAELEVRREVRRLAAELRADRWRVRTIDLQKLLLDRVRAMGEGWPNRVAEMERRMASIDADRGLGYLKSKLIPLIEGPEGLAADCSRLIRKEVEANPDGAERTLALIGRAGALYPFFRSSGLLRHIDGQTLGAPVVLLYPGGRRGRTGLSFMDQLEPDNDYRPRIYP